MSYDLRPSKFPERGITRFIHKDPPVLMTRRPAPVFVRSPPAGFHWVASLHVALGAVIHEVVQLGKDFLGHPNAEVITPTSDQGVHLVDQGYRGRAHVFAPNPFEFPLNLTDRLVARFNQQLIATARAVWGRVMPDVKSEEIEPFS